MEKSQAVIARSAGEQLQHLIEAASRAAAKNVVGSVGKEWKPLNAFCSRLKGKGDRLFLFPLPFRGYKRRTTLLEGLGRVMIRVEKRTITSSDNAH